MPLLMYFSSKGFTEAYANKLLDYNQQYLELRDMRERLYANIGILDSIRYQQNKKYHYISPGSQENTLVCSLIQADNLEGNP